MPLFGLLLDLPSATSTLEGMGQYSKPFFAEMLPYILPILGLGIVLWAIRKFTKHV